MKKLIAGVLIFAGLAIFNASAAKSGGLGLGKLAAGVSNLASGSAKPVSGPVYNGRDILPVIFKTMEVEPNSDKILDGFLYLQSVDLDANTYKVCQSVVFKAMVGQQRQDSVFEITTDGTNFTVTTLNLQTYNVDKKLKRTGEIVENSESSKTKLNKMIAEEIEKNFKMGDEEFAKYENIAYTNIDVLQAVSLTSTNKLKAKKWFKEHSVEGKTSEFKFVVSNIDESKKAGYAYVLNALYYPKNSSFTDSIFISYYTNNDAVIDYKTDTLVTVKGTISNLRFDDFGSIYKVSSIEITE